MLHCNFILLEYLCVWKMLLVQEYIEQLRSSMPKIQPLQCVTYIYPQILLRDVHLWFEQCCISFPNLEISQGKSSWSSHSHKIWNSVGMVYQPHHRQFQDFCFCLRSHSSVFNKKRVIMFNYPAWKENESLLILLYNKRRKGKLVTPHGLDVRKNRKMMRTKVHMENFQPRQWNVKKCACLHVHMHGLQGRG